MHVDSKPFHEVTRDIVPFEWTAEHETLLNDLKGRISEDTILSIPSERYPFQNHVKYSSVGTVYILVQEFPEGTRVWHYQSIITQFQNLKIIWTPGENQVLPDKLNQNLSPKETNKQLIKHKGIQKEIKFFDENGQEIKYFINHDDNKARSSNDFFHIISHHNNITRQILFRNKMEHSEQQ